MSLDFGVVTYDVPKKRKSAYAKIRRKLRRKSVMQTWSAYLFPWGLYEEIKEILEDLNTDEDGLALPVHQQVRYSIFKYDSAVSGKALQQSAQDAMTQMIGNAKKAINEMLYELQADTGEERDDKVKSAYNACGRAKTIKQDVEALAVIFNLTDDLKAGILAFQGYILAKQKEIEVLEKGSVGQVAEVEEKTDAKEMVAPEPIEETEQAQLDELIALLDE